MTDADPIVVQETYEAPVDAVWQAITDESQMRQWFFEPMTAFKPEPGFETEFDVHCDGVDYRHVWKVTEVVPGKRIAYEWRYGGYPGDSHVTWELVESPEGTRLTLTHRGHQTFPQDNPTFSRESCEGGWKYFLQETLKGFLGRRGS